MSGIEINKKIFDNYADYYCDDGEYEWRKVAAVSKADNIISLCGNFPHETILEIGAGEGAILERISELNFGKELSAVEISPSGVEAIKKRAIPRLVDAQCFDGYHLPYKDGQFDLAVLSHVVEHLEYPRQLLCEAKRVAKIIFIEVPLDYTIIRAWDFHFDKVGHINFYSPKLIRWLLQSCNIEVIEQRTVLAGKGNYIFKEKTKGLIKYFIKKIFLGLAPPIASLLSNYIAILVCKGSSVTSVSAIDDRSQVMKTQK